MTKTQYKQKDKIALSELLFSEKPAHWPSSSYYSVRSAIRALARSIPLEQPLDIFDLPELIDENLPKASGSKEIWTLRTYRGRILRLAAEKICRKPLKPWEATRFFEKLNLTNNRKE